MAAILSKGRLVKYSLYNTAESTAMTKVEHRADFNSLASGKFEWNYRHVIFKQILVIDGWGISCEIALIWTSLDFTNDQSLVQVMAWCRHHMA